MRSHHHKSTARDATANNLSAAKVKRSTNILSYREPTVGRPGASKRVYLVVGLEDSTQGIFGIWDTALDIFIRQSVYEEQASLDQHR